MIQNNHKEYVEQQQNELYSTFNLSFDQLLNKKENEYLEKQNHLKQICKKHKVKRDIFKEIE